MIKLQLSQRLDDHGLSDCIVQYFALEAYRHSLKQAEKEGLAYPAYFQQAHQIIDDLSCQLMEGLLGLNQPETDAERELLNILSYIDPRKGGARG